MRLKLTQLPVPKHKEMCAAVGWTPNNELFSCADDFEIVRWDINGEPMGTVTKLDTNFTDVQFYTSKQRQPSSNDLFAVACTDGTFRLITVSGRLEKTVEAHRGAVLTIRWNNDGQALLTAGEDGMIKIWSRSGMLRSQFYQSANPVYSLDWSPRNDTILFTSGKDLLIKPVQPPSKTVQWKAHDGLVLKVDWNPVNNMIVSSGEDKRYKIWDFFGRAIYQSQPFEYVITSVAWAPDGELFAVGSFDMIRLCDKTGWSYSRQKPSSGSVFSISWSADGTQIACGGGNGSVVFGHIVERRLETESLDVVLGEDNRIKVHDVESDAHEDLEFRDRVIKMSLGFGHLVVATATQLVIYSTDNWNTPHISDIRGTITLIRQSERHFLTVDHVNGIQIFTYDGRVVSNPRSPSLRVELLNEPSVSLAADALAVIDNQDPTLVHVFEVASGRPIGEPIKHTTEIAEVLLELYGAATDRKLAIIDRNRELFVTPMSKKNLVKIGNMVNTAIWSDNTGMLAVIMDQKFCVFYYPNVVFVDPDLLTGCKFVRDGSEFGKNPHFVNFLGNRLTVRRGDGALVSTLISPYPALLYEQFERSEWDKCVGVCRYVKDETLWTCLAAMALFGRNLDTAEVALAAIDEIDKLQFVNYLKERPREEIRNAMLALHRKRPDEAEAILIQAGLHYRAIKMHIKMFNWEKALDIAMKYKTHIDTVMMHRKQYLKDFERKETHPKFLQFGQLEIDEQAVRAKIAADKEKERR